MIPATWTSPPSASASTSTSIAFSRKRSSSSGMLLVGLDVGLQVGGEVLGRIADLHRAAAEHVGGPDQEREANVSGDHRRLVGGERGPVGRVGDAEAAQKGAEAAAVLGEVDRVDRGAEQRHTRLLEGAGKLQRGLAAELDDHALGALLLADGEHVLGGQRLEVEAVGGVVVGGDRLRVAVDHHRVAAQLAGGHRRVHAAVVELDPLADPVGAGAEDYDGIAIAAADLRGGRAAGKGALVGRVVIGRRRLELRRAGVDRLVGAGEALGAVALGRQHLQLPQEPAVDETALVHRLDVDPAAEGLQHQVEAVRAGPVEAFEQLRVGVGQVGRRVQLPRTQRLGEGLAEGAADRHHLADALHVRGEAPLGAGELLEGEARNLRHHVVDRRLEAGHGFSGDVVGDLLQRVADRQLRRHLGDREAGRLGGERRGARDARVHLDHDDLTVTRVDGELDVGATRLHPDGPDHPIAWSRSSW